MADGRATAFMGLRTVRQESHETVINFVLRIGLLASRAYSNNWEMADCINLLVLKRGINGHLRPAVARAATLNTAMNIAINISGRNFYRSTLVNVATGQKNLKD